MRALFVTGTTVFTAAITIVACGSDKATPDGSLVIIDSPVDMAPPIDAPPDAPSYDFSCLGQPNPTTADDPITIAGTTETLSQTGLQALPDVTVQVFKSTSTNALDTQTSDANGNFTTGNITTNAVPFDGYIKGTLDGYRTSYLYPPSPAAASISNVPVPLFDTATFGLIASQVAHVTQDDANNGALFLTVTDCANTPINGATINVKQGGQSVGMQFDLGILAEQAAGIIIVFNVPDGETEISGSYGGMDFPVHTVVAHKQGNGMGAVGTLTLTTVRPGPL
jgi:hypothetical protein